MISAIAIALAATAASLLSAQKTTSTINVTTTFYDYNATTQLLTRSDDYNALNCGSGCATYATSGRGVSNSMTSHITRTGDWELYIGNQSVRTLYITPNEPAGSQPAGPPPGYYCQNVEAYSRCYDSAANVVPFPNLINGSKNCSLEIAVRPKLSCAVCSQIVQAPAPNRPIDRGLAGPGLLAHVLVSKYADHRVPRRHLAAMGCGTV